MLKEQFLCNHVTNVVFPRPTNHPTIPAIWWVRDLFHDVRGDRWFQVQVGGQPVSWYILEVSKTPEVIWPLEKKHLPVSGLKRDLTRSKWGLGWAGAGAAAIF